MKSIRTTLSLVALAATCAYGQTVAYTNFTSTDHSYNGSSVYLFGQDPNNSNFKYSLGFQFISNVSGTVSDLFAAVDSNTGTPSSVSLAVYSDNGASAPLTQLGDSMTGTTAGTYNGLMHFSYSGGAGSMGASLTAGTAYWLVATSNDSIQNQWAQNTAIENSAAISANGNQSFQYIGSPYQGYMEIDVAPAPEPLMLVPLAAGLIGVLALKRKA